MSREPPTEVPATFAPPPETGGAAAGNRGDLVGTVLAGRYRIIEKLGEGAMGAVYLGEHLKMGRRDAIKLLRAPLTADAEAVARFARGTRNAARIRHPNVCTIYDHSDTGDGLQFVAMELVAGESLQDLLKRERALPLERSIAIAAQVADALEAAHETGIVHRDLKPGNIMLARGRDGSDVVKVVDFDIAKGSLEGEGDEVTRLGFVVGTPEYMSPEQLTGDRLDGRSDLYSLALVLFRMISGALPFRGETVHEIMLERLTGKPLRLYEAIPDATFPPELQRTFDRALQLRPADRHENAAELGAEIRALRSGGSPAAAVSPSAALGWMDDVPQTQAAGTPPGVAGSIGHAVPHASLAPAARLVAAARRRPLRLAAGAGVLVMVLVLTLWLVDRRKPVPVQEPTAPPAVAAAEPTPQPLAGSVGVADVPTEVADEIAESRQPTSATAPVPASAATTDAAPTPPSGIRIAAPQLSLVLGRLFNRVGPPYPSRARVAAIRDTAVAVWEHDEASTADRALAAYLAGSAWFALDSPQRCAEWLNRAVNLQPANQGYQTMLANCEPGGG